MWRGNSLLLSAYFLTESSIVWWRCNGSVFEFWLAFFLLLLFLCSECTIEMTKREEEGTQCANDSQHFQLYNTQRERDYTIQQTWQVFFMFCFLPRILFGFFFVFCNLTNLMATYKSVWKCRKDQSPTFLRIKFDLLKRLKSIFIGIKKNLLSYSMRTLFWFLFKFACYIFINPKG